MFSPSSCRKAVAGRQAFTLLELLAVMAILVSLSVVSIPAIHSINSGSLVKKAEADLSRTLELARVHAMANRTYVRVLFSQLPAGNGRITPATLALPVFSADGSSGLASDMNNPALWPSLSKPLVLDDLLLFDTLNGNTPNDTSGDITPMGSNLQGAFMASVSREVPGQGTLTFTGVIQFGPTGEARVCFDEPARHIKIALDQAGADGSGLKKNPFILRLSAMNGSLKVLRAEDIAL